MDGNASTTTAAAMTKEDVVKGWLSKDFANVGKSIPDKQLMIDAYDLWAETYDQDSVGRYNGPMAGALKLSQVLKDKAARILDCACGTGQVGKMLQKCDFTNVDGTDISAVSLEKAKKTGYYQHTFLCDIMAEGLPCADDTYNAITVGGGFLLHHLTQEVFPEFIRVIKPGGYLVITMKESVLAADEGFRDGQFERAMGLLVEKGSWRYECRQRVENYLENDSGVCFLFRIN